MENYHVLELIGEGSFGKVYKVCRNFFIVFLSEFWWNSTRGAVISTAIRAAASILVRSWPWSSSSSTESRIKISRTFVKKSTFCATWITKTSSCCSIGLRPSRRFVWSRSMARYIHIYISFSNLSWNHWFGFPCWYNAEIAINSACADDVMTGWIVRDPWGRWQPVRRDRSSNRSAIGARSVLLALESHHSPRHEAAKYLDWRQRLHQIVRFRIRTRHVAQHHGADFHQRHSIVRSELLNM